MLIIATTTTTAIATTIAKKASNFVLLSSVDDIRGVSLDDSTAYSYIRQETGVRLKKKNRKFFQSLFLFIFSPGRFSTDHLFSVYEIRKKKVARRLRERDPGSPRAGLPSTHNYIQETGPASSSSKQQLGSLRPSRT